MRDPQPGDVLVSAGLGWDWARLWQLIRDDPVGTVGVPHGRITCITAMTGNEFPDTKDLNEAHILPEMAELGIRYVQIARKGPSERDGIVVLSDTSAPTELHIKGDFYTLYDEMRDGGTVPQYGGTGHKCAIKFKGAPIGKWVKAWRGDLPYISVIGYNVDEGKRIAKAAQYDTAALQQTFPLMTRGEGHDLVRAHVRWEYGEWAKSCCFMCPFTVDRTCLVERHRKFPDGGAEALLLEFVSMALNSRMTLYSGGRSLHRTIAEARETDHATTGGSQLDEVVTLYTQALNEAPWTVYRVRRVYHENIHQTDRDLRAFFEGSRAAMQEKLAMLGPVEERDGHLRVYLRRRQGTQRPSVEEFFVIAPKRAKNKSKKQFWDNWVRATWRETVPDPLEQFRQTTTYAPFEIGEQLVLEHV